WTDAAGSTVATFSRNEFRVNPGTGRFARRMTAWKESGADESAVIAVVRYSNGNPGRPDQLTLIDPTAQRLRSSGALERELFACFVAAPVGYFHLDDRRVDALLKDARSLGVRPQPERVRGGGGRGGEGG